MGAAGVGETLDLMQSYYVDSFESLFDGAGVEPIPDDDNDGGGEDDDDDSSSTIRP